MKLNDIIINLKNITVAGFADIDISGIAYDSRNIKNGDVFVGIPGFKFDGTAFVDQAVKNGAVAVVIEKDAKVPASITKVIVPNTRIALAEISSAYYGYPSRKLKMIGVTGTNGKTTTSYLIEAILHKAGHKVGLIGTVETKINGKSLPQKLTTPESLELQGLLADMIRENVTHVVMEVSSHSLELYRTHGCEFDVAIYTNLSHDHLDFHGNMQNYFKAKLKLFEKLGRGFKKEVTGIVNVDDPYGKKIMTFIDGNILTYGAINNANLDAANVDISLDKMTFEVSTNDSTLKISTRLIGMYNAYNIMAAMLCGRAFGIPLESCKEAIESVKSVPGRFEKVDAGQKYPVIVDFAHTPDSLKKLLETVRPLTKGRILLVFGCPGERDRTKRPLMGDIAIKLADFSIITTDDPHAEAPDMIIREIEEGMVRAGGDYQKTYIKLEDRKAAIEKVLSMASSDDVVVIAGRGHEKFQDYNGVKVDIDDREVVKNYIRLQKD